MSRLLPILYSPPMADALWRGRKTETRRLLPQPPKGARYAGIHFASNEPDSHFFNSPSGPFKVRRMYEEGDRLWVREPWRVSRNKDAVKPSLIPQRSLTTFFEAGGQMAGKTRYRPDRQAGEYLFSEGGLPFPDWIGKKRPGMFMMPWQSRMTLTVEKVVVERLQSITDAAALREGVDQKGAVAGSDVDIDGQWWPGGPIRQYQRLWDSLNANRAAWATNPWIVAYTFSVRRLNFELCK